MRTALQRAALASVLAVAAPGGRRAFRAAAATSGSSLMRQVRLSALLVVALIVCVLVGGGVAGGATVVVITAPADGSTQMIGYDGPVSVDLSGGDLGSYVVTVTGPGGYLWQASVDYDGSQPLQSWTITPLSASGSYTVSVQAPDSTVAASSSFTVPADGATVISPASGAIFHAPYSGPVRVHWNSVSNPAGSYSVRAYRDGALWATLCSFTGSVVTGQTTSCAHAFPPGSSYEIRIINDSTSVTFSQGTTFGVGERPLTVASAVKPAAFYPLERDGYRDTVRFSARPNMTSRVSVVVRNRLGRVMRRARLGRVVHRHRVSWRWDGRTSSGRRVKPGVFAIYAVARGHGQRVTSPARLATVRRLPLRVSLRANRHSFKAPTHAVTLAFKTSLRARATLRIVSGRGRVVRIVSLGRVRAKRWHRWRWHGTGSSGRAVRAGRYQVRVTATRPGQRVISRGLQIRVRRASGGGGRGCTPGYSPCLVSHGGADYDCYGRGGNGPYYTAPGVVYAVTGSDPYDLDRDGNGRGCES
jgi:flagellar hook assembly protein FlgD